MSYGFDRLADQLWDDIRKPSAYLGKGASTLMVDPMINGKAEMATTSRYMLLGPTVAIGGRIM